VRVVTTTRPRPAGVRFDPEVTEAVVRDKTLRSRLRAADDQNETVIRAQTLEQWLPPASASWPDAPACPWATPRRLQAPDRPTDWACSP
jgi:hypothetical protein